MPVRLALLVALVALAFGAVACGDDGGGSGGGSGGGAEAADLPSGAVATVGDVEITQDDLDEQVASLRAQSRGGGGGANRPTAAPSRAQLEQQAMSMLLQTAWLEQEAEERDIEVSDAAVRRRWEAAVEGQFPTKRALRRFLGGQSEQDVLAQLRLQALTEAIHGQIRKEADRKGADAAVQRFQREFERRWKDRTACSERYATPACGDAG